MNDEEIKKIIDGPLEYEESKEDTLISMVGQLYSKEMFPNFIAHFMYSLPFIAGAIFCGVKFFYTELVQYQIMYATIFLVCIEGMIFSKDKYWKILHKRNISREIKRLELRIAELTETVKRQQKE